MIADAMQARELVKQYGSDFFQGIVQMPRDTQKAVVQLYMFVRVPDQIVDTKKAENQADLMRMKQELERYWTRRKVAYSAQDSSDEQFGPVVALFQNYNIDPAYADAFFQSMIMDTAIFRYSTYEDLRHYIYGSAEVIGLMMTQIIGTISGEKITQIGESQLRHYELLLHSGGQNSHDQNQAMKTAYCAAKLGEAFQLANFLRDVREDRLLGRIYLPADILEKHGVSESDIENYSGTRQIDENFSACMKELVDRCDLMHDEANEGIALLTSSCQQAIRLSSNLHRKILNKIRDYDYNVFDEAFDKNSFGRLAD